MDNDSISDLFARFGPVEIKRMFGGKGVYHRGVITAIELRDELMLKADGDLAKELEAAGCTQWTYTHSKTGKNVSMPYWSVPDGAADDPDEMAGWAKKSYAAGLRAEKAKAKKK